MQGALRLNQKTDLDQKGSQTIRRGLWGEGRDCFLFN